MRFTHVGDRAPARQRAGARSRPEWFREWLANKARYVELSCGHKADLNDRYVVMMLSDHGVACDDCRGAWVTVVRKLSLLEYHGMKPPKEHDTPMF